MLVVLGGPPIGGPPLGGPPIAAKIKKIEEIYTCTDYLSGAATAVVAIGPPLRRWERRAWTGQPPHIGRRGLVPWKSWPVVCRGGGLDRPPVRPSLTSLSVSPPLFLRRRLLASVVPSSPSSFASACAIASSLLSVDFLRFLRRRFKIHINENIC